MDPQTSPPGGRPGITRWVKSHKTAAAAIAAAAGLGVFMLVRSGSAAAASGSPSTAAGTSANPATYTDTGTGTGTGDYSGTYDAAMQGVSDALAQWTASSSSSPAPTGGTGTSTGGGSSSTGGGTAKPPPNKKHNPNAHSWTDTGQSWSAAQLAAALGIPVSALRASNSLGSKGLADPNAALARGAAYTYLQTPAEAAKGVKPKPRVLKPPITVRRTPVKA